MGNWKKHYSTKHLCSTDIPEGRDITVTIKAIGSIDMDEERKMLVTFESSAKFAAICKKKTWVAAKTCGYCIEAMFGDQDGAWIGKRVTLHVEQVPEVFGATVDAIRVKGSPDIGRSISIRVRQGNGKGKLVINLQPTGQAGG